MKISKVWIGGQQKSFRRDLIFVKKKGHYEKFFTNNNQNSWKGVVDK
jgi:hypothetical protein